MKMLNQCHRVDNLLFPHVKFLLCDVKENLPASPKAFDLIFIDPPYCEDYQEILGKLNEKKWLTEKSLIVCEFKTGQESQLNGIGFLKQLESRKYGKTTFVFCQIERSL